MPVQGSMRVPIVMAVNPSSSRVQLGLAARPQEHIFPKKIEGNRAMSYSGTKVKTTIAELVVAFPAAFTLDPTLVRPVKLGIKDDLYARSAISRRRITAALRFYCNSAHYLSAS